MHAHSKDPLLIIKLSYDKFINFYNNYFKKIYPIYI